MEGLRQRPIRRGARVGGAPTGGGRPSRRPGGGPGALRRSPPTRRAAPSTHSPTSWSPPAGRLTSRCRRSGTSASSLGPRPPARRSPTRRTRRPTFALAHAEEPRESQAVVRLRSELVLALDEVERQQRLRSEAEERARRVATSPPAVDGTPSSPPPPRRRALWIVLEFASVVAAVAVFFVVLDSTYAAVVAGLTTGAVVLALDSLFAVRSRGDVSASGPASVTPLRAPRGRRLSRS